VPDRGIEEQTGTERGMRTVERKGGERNGDSKSEKVWKQAPQCQKIEYFQRSTDFEPKNT
jgi:hypothetical protein